MAWQVYWLVSILVYHQARDGCSGAPLGDSSPPGAGGHSFVALEQSLDQGALRNFDLFYPQLPDTTPTPVKEETSYAVPVIHLPAEENDDDIEKVAADAILDMFRQDLLENNKKVRPVDVKIIEHDGYIDYEIEFIELTEYYDDYHHSDNSDVLQIKAAATEKPSIEVLSDPELTFVDLLMEARKQHRKKENKTEEETPSSTPRETVKSQIEEQKILENPNKRRKESGDVISSNKINSSNSNTEEELIVSDSTVRSEPLHVTERDSFVNTVTLKDDQESHRIPENPNKRRKDREEVMKSSSDSTVRSEPVPVTEGDIAVNTVTPADNQETTTTAETTTTISPQLEEPRSSDRSYENIQIADKEESVGSVQKPEDVVFDQLTEEFQISESRSRLSVYNSEAPGTTETNNYDYYEEVEFTTNINNNQFEDDFSKPERRPKVIRNENHDGRQNILIPNLETKDQTEVPSAEGSLKGNAGYYQHDATGDTAEPYVHDKRGQYKEIHPGQYSEIHPGQYEETHPGQYNEVNPGQYTLDDKDIEVDVNSRDNESRIYNVRANAGDFIIGEAGRIDNSGQTLEGVRYTAVESEVDYEKIKEILERYFGAR